MNRLAIILSACGLACSAPAARAPVATPTLPPPAPRGPDHPARLDEVRPARASAVAPAPLLAMMTAELQRSYAALAKHADPPYFASYEVTDSLSAQVSASLGVLKASSGSRERALDVDVRVGDHKRDDTHRTSGRAGHDAGTVSTGLPIDDDPFAISANLWADTDAAYKSAAEQLARVKAAEKVSAAEDDPADDFSTEPPETDLEPPATATLDRAAWEPRLRALSAAFASHPEILYSSVSIQLAAQTRYYVNIEGTRYQIPAVHYRVIVSGSTLLEDGMELHRMESFDETAADQLPTDAAIRGKIDKLIADLDALRAAPVAEPYSGPAILEGQAASVFFHEVFGHRIEGHRQKDREEGQTFAKKIGEQIMPEFLSVYDDPSIATLNGVDLNGFYRADDEGVPAQKASLVEHGVLKTFLLGRSPARGFVHSNGHGRREQGRSVVARQGNLVVAASRTVSPAELRAQLLAEVKRQGKPYGLIFKELDGGFTMTERFSPQAFKLLPLMVYRVYPDGHEQLVRGADFDGTPLAALADIVAAGDDVATFNGYCGAESGFVPVSSSAPSLLMSHVELTKKSQGQTKLPILAAPPVPGSPEASAASAAGSGGGSAFDRDPFVRAIRDELARATTELTLPGEPKPYLTTAAAWDTRLAIAFASMGALERSAEDPSRHVELDLRVGDYAFDNGNASGRATETAHAPRDDDYALMRRSMWLALDDAYKRSTAGYERKKAIAKDEIKDPDEVAALSHEPPLHLIAAPAAAPSPRDGLGSLEALAKKLSAVFRDNPDAYSGLALAARERGRMVVLSSDGTAAEQPWSRVRVDVSCSTQAPDGMPLHASRQWFADTAASLPPEAEMIAATAQLSKELSARRAAPIVDDYAGPILLVGPAADQALRALLAQEFGGTPPPKSSRAGAHDVADSALAGKIGTRILPRGMTVVDEPSVGFAFDEEGVATQKVSLVENGIFKRFLMSRTPRKGFEHSNGHGFRTGSATARAYPIHLDVTSTKSVSDAELKKRAIAAAKDEGLPYAMVIERFEDFGGDADAAQRSSPLPPPAVMEKLFADGHEELVRGGTLASITVRSLRDIEAVGTTATTYTYQASGYRAAITAPSLLLHDGEVKKPLGGQRAVPIAPRPAPSTP